MKISTFYEDILRMPAGHAMIGKDAGLRIWRYWDPSNLSEQKFTSLQECTDAFMDQLRVAVKCRLRSVKPVGALLSGGLDSSTIVGLVSKEFWGELREPLRTYSLILEDRENCADWRNIKAILQADSSLLPTIVTSAAVDGNWQLLLDSIPNADEPFGVVNGLTSNLVLQEVSASDCGVLLEGMAGDVLFYGASRTAVELLRQRRYDLIPGLLAGYRNHGYGGGLTDILGVFLRNLAPDFARASMRRRRDERQVGEGSMKILQADVARSYLASKRTPAFLSGERVKAVSDQIWHAQLLTTGLVSFAHEVGSTLALARGIEVRSPFSDRRMFEFAIKMPLEGKIFAPWYKYLLRKGASGMLPDSVRWRREIGGHPGWAFYERLGRNIARDAPEMCRVSSHNKKLARWVDVSRIGELWDRFESLDDAVSGQQAVRILLLSQWLSSHSF
jgi:asparagine synthase (glutamine-hydrolysing)